MLPLQPAEPRRLRIDVIIANHFRRASAYIHKCTRDTHLAIPSVCLSDRQPVLHTLLLWQNG